MKTSFKAVITSYASERGKPARTSKPIRVSPRVTGSVFAIKRSSAEFSEDACSEDAFEVAAFIFAGKSRDSAGCTISPAGMPVLATDTRVSPTDGRTEDLKVWVVDVGRNIRGRPSNMKNSRIRDNPSRDHARVVKRRDL